MLYLTQSKLSGESIKGNCFKTCLACLLDIEDVDRVPAFEEMNDDWFKHFFKFLYNNKLDYNGTSTIDKLSSINFNGIDGYYIVGGKSPRGIMHAVIYKDAKLEWDPHPSREGILTEDFVYLIEK